MAVRPAYRAFMAGASLLALASCGGGGMAPSGGPMGGQNGDDMAQNGDGQSNGSTDQDAALTIPEGLSASPATPVLARDVLKDTATVLIPDPSNQFAALTAFLLRKDQVEEGEDRLTLATGDQQVFIRSITSDGAGGFDVTYVVPPDERFVVSFEASERDEDGDYRKDNGIRLYNWSGLFSAEVPSWRNRFFHVIEPVVPTDLDADGNHDGDLTGFSTFGARPESLHDSGTATYSGIIRGKIRDSETGSSWAYLRGGLSLSVDFGQKSISGEVDEIEFQDRTVDRANRQYALIPDTNRFQITGGEIADGQFTAALTGEDSDTSRDLRTSVGGFHGDILGEFYGPNAEEAGGVLSAVRTEDGSLIVGFIVTNLDIPETVDDAIAFGAEQLSESEIQDLFGDGVRLLSARGGVGGWWWRFNPDGSQYSQSMYRTWNFYGYTWRVHNGELCRSEASGSGEEFCSGIYRWKDYYFFFFFEDWENEGMTEDWLLTPYVHWQVTSPAAARGLVGGSVLGMTDAEIRAAIQATAQNSNTLLQSDRPGRRARHFGCPGAGRHHLRRNGL